MFSISKDVPSQDQATSLPKGKSTSNPKGQIDVIDPTINKKDSKIKRKRRKKKKSKNVVFRRAITKDEALESQRPDSDCTPELRLISESD